MEDYVYDILTIDAKMRKVGVTGDLYRLCDVKQKSWDYSLPTLVERENVFLKEKIKSTSEEEIAQQFFKKYPYLKGINWDNLLVAGGCIGNFIYGNEANDVDIFIWGLDREQATSKIEHVCETIHKNLEQGAIEDIKKRNKNCQDPEEIPKSMSEKELELQYIRTRNSLTIQTEGNCHISGCQIIFRLYSSPSEILHGFDLGSSAIGFDGQNVWLTSLGKFAYEYGFNIIDTSRRSTTYEHRLRKYFGRGFEIIMPRLNIDSISTQVLDEYYGSDICKLPYLTFTYRDRQGNKIVLDKFYDRRRTGDSNYSDYAEDGNEYGLFYTNVSRLLQKDFKGIVYLADNYKEILYHPKCFTPSKIQYFYDQLVTKFLGATFPSRTVEKYFTKETPETIFAMRNDKEKIKQLAKDQIDIVLQLSRELASQDNSIPWLVENPGTQLVGSFNPIIEDESQWYGQYYLL